MFASGKADTPVINKKTITEADPGALRRFMEAKSGCPKIIADQRIVYLFRQ